MRQTMTDFLVSQTFQTIQQKLTSAEDINNNLL